MTQRDTFINELFLHAKSDGDIVLITVDMGAPALDQWRKELPGQFFSAGISEQNAINVAGGLSSQGKKVYVYMMACWMARCLEQIRYSCAMPGNPITLLGNGVGLGYAPAGPAHEPNDDICYMRSVVGLNIFSPASEHLIPALVKLTLNSKSLNYVRLERSVPEAINVIVNSKGALFLESFEGNPYVFYDENSKDEKDILIFSSGFMLDRAKDVCLQLQEQRIHAEVVDICRIAPLDYEEIQKFRKKHSFIVTIEEQTLAGGFGSAVAEAFIGQHNCPPILRIGLANRYIFENGTREELLNANGLSVDTIVDRILNVYSKSRV